MSEALTVRKASFLSYRLFEVGDEVDLVRAEGLLAGGTARTRPARERSEALEIPNPPLAVPLGRKTLLVCGAEAEVDLEARIFDFGVVSLLATLSCPTPATLESLVDVADDLYDSPVLLQLARGEADVLMERLAPAVRRAHHWEGHEEYTVLFLEEVCGSEGPATASELLRAEQAVVRVIVGERSPLPLAKAERDDVLRQSFSYQERDVAAIDWNSALVLEPSGSRDIPDLLEFATAQLLELRYYDMLLDRELVRIYSEISRRRQGFLSLFWGRYSRLSREMTRLVVELAEFNERVENALKIVGDFYLARVYMGAVSRFRIPVWQQAVTRKQALLAQAYALLKTDLDTRRTLVLEILVAGLIVVELLLVLKL